MESKRGEGALERTSPNNIHRPNPVIRNELKLAERLRAPSDSAVIYFVSLLVKRKCEVSGVGSPPHKLLGHSSSTSEAVYPGWPRAHVKGLGLCQILLRKDSSQ